MNKEQIDEIALRVAKLRFVANHGGTGEGINFSNYAEFAATFLAELAKQSEPVAYIDEALRFKWLIGHDEASKIIGKKLYAAPLPQPDLVAEIERLKQYRATDATVLGAMKIELDELRQQLSAAQADNDSLVKALEEVETQYFALLKEKDTEAEWFKAEGDMYGWNFHTGMRSGAVQMHLYMTNLLKLAAAHKARQSPLTCDGCGKTIAEHDKLLNCQQGKEQQ